MKKGKRDATGFVKLTANLMNKIKGGDYIKVTINGKEYLVWVPS